MKDKPIWIGVLALALWQACCWWPVASAAKPLITNFADLRPTIDNTCQLETISTFELSTLSHTLGVPHCNAEEMFAVTTESGQIFMRDSPTAKLRSATNMHYYGVFSAPWYLYQVVSFNSAQALVDSLYFTEDPSRSGLYFVNDYCYYMWWLSAAESENFVEESPLQYILKLYDALAETSAWQEQDGGNFVFFLPYSLSHVAEYERSRPGGGQMREYLDYICETFDNAFIITAENFQTNAICKKDKHSRKSLVAPLVPNVMDVKGQALSGSLADMRGAAAAGERDVLIYFTGRCSQRARDPARGLRAHIVATLATAGPDVMLKCIEAEPHGRMPFDQMLQEMQKSVFCLIVPANAQTARILGEAMLAGCIPVFLGPPFAAVPLSQDLAYSDFSLTYHLDSHALWTAADEEENADKAHELLALSMRGREIDATFSEVTELVETLRSFSESKKTAALQAVQHARHHFLYYPELSDTELSNDFTATDMLMLKLCQHLNYLSNAG